MFVISASARAVLWALLLLLLRQGQRVASGFYASLPLQPCAGAHSGTAILLSAGRFAFGCQALNRSSPESFFLTVSFNHSGRPPVWIANPSRPVSVNATLYLRSLGNLVLWESGAAAAAWSTNITSSSAAVGVTLDGSGELRIVDSGNLTLWRSFLYPLDLLLPGQVMKPGMKLVAGIYFSSISPAGSASAGMSPSSASYSAVMESSGLAFFVNISDSSSVPYSVFSFTSDSGNLDEAMEDGACGRSANGNGSSVQLQLFYDGTRLILQCESNFSNQKSIQFGSDQQNQVAVDFLRLDADGNMRGYRYHYDSETWSVVYDWFANINANNSLIGVCNLPSICGPYGICSHSSTDKSKYYCSCPQLSANSNPNQDQKLFLPLNSSDLRQGCRLSRPLNCRLGETSQYFIELQDADYFANHALSPSQISISRREKCLNSCAHNCSCKAAFYRADVAACFHYEQVLSIIGLANSTQMGVGLLDPTQLAANLTGLEANVTQLGSGSDNTTHYVAYLKVQNISVANTSAGGSSKGSSKYLTLGISIGSTMAGLFLIFLSILLWVCCKKKRRFKALGLGDEDFYNTLPGQPIRFTFTQLQEASCDFKSKLGVGGFGSVYKGTLPNGSIVAIKQLESAIQGLKEFKSQIMSLTSLNHPNLIRLHGFCAEGSHRLLIYEYMINESLDAWIFNKPIKEIGNCSSSPSLDWNTRFSIALDVAKGLAYLHQANLIHLDIKPQNILLDDRFVAKLSDYGLSILLDQDEGRLITHMRGTPGYMAPEWLLHTCATEKSDVYSYGMVLMEILGGRKNVDLSKQRDSWYFPALAAKMYKEGKVLEVLDEKLTKSNRIGTMEDTECNQAKRLIQIAFWCIQEEPTKRPDMEKLLLMLEGHKEVPEPPLIFQFGGGNSGANYDANHHYQHNNYQSGSSSPSCLNISFPSEPSSMATYNAWSSNGGPLDDCRLLLPARD